VGDVMYDAALVFGEIAGRKSTILHDLGLSPKEYLLVTVHRAENTDDPVWFGNIMQLYRNLQSKSRLSFPSIRAPASNLSINNQRSAISTLLIPSPFWTWCRWKRTLASYSPTPAVYRKRRIFRAFPVSHCGTKLNGWKLLKPGGIRW